MKKTILSIASLFVMFLATFFVASASTQEKVSELLDKAMLPLQIARLRLLPADQVLLMPVLGARVDDVADTWGGPRSGGRTHQGQDIFAKKGTVIYSATDGYIYRVGQNTLGGNTVWVMGAGGIRYYYAHLDGYAPGIRAGDAVSTTTALGYVGNTGNAKNTPPHLHFGAYGRGGAFNPLPMLRDRV